jgi:pimeloyl-ACP methyl ester carboxylesterase
MPQVRIRSRIWKVAKLTLLSLAVLILVSLGGGLAYRAYRHRELAKATVIDPVKGIDEAFFTKIGGIDQWIGIRGQDRENPVLLLLHGGPGIALSPLPRDFLFSWTRDFTIVLWDQRGAGKTFGRSGPVAADVTKDRMAQDGIEVAEFIRTRLGKSKVAIVAVSWGTAIGVRMAKARPDLFSLYVGSGQSVNQGKYRRVAYRQLLAEAHTRNDRQAIAELEANGPPPYDSVSKATVHTKWANRYEPGQLSRGSLISAVLFDSNASLKDLRDYVRGVTSSQDHFRDAVEREDVPSLGTTFAIPFFVFQGAIDNVTPVAPVREYVDRVIAPQKALVLIPNAGHNVIATRSDEFLKLLLERIRPLALQSQ